MLVPADGLPDEEVEDGVGLLLWEELEPLWPPDWAVWDDWELLLLEELEEEDEELLLLDEVDPLEVEDEEGLLEEEELLDDSDSDC